MGAWGYKAAESDEAQEWLHNAVRIPLVNAISAAIDRCFANENDEVAGTEAEVAIALLLELINNHSLISSSTTGMAFEAKSRKLWDRAFAAISMVRFNTQTHGTWDDPGKKVEILDALLVAIDAARSEPK